MTKKHQAKLSAATAATNSPDKADAIMGTMGADDGRPLL